MADYSHWEYHENNEMPLASSRKQDIYPVIGNGVDTVLTCSHVTNLKSFRSHFDILRYGF